MPHAAAGFVLAAAAFFASGSDLVQTASPLGWVGPLLLAAVGAYSLWQAGSMRAWKSTAEGRGERIEDLSAEVAALKAEMEEPGRYEGMIRLMNENADRRSEALMAALREMLEAQTTTLNDGRTPPGA